MKIVPKEMKRRARQALTGNYAPAVSLTFTLTLLTSVLAALIQSSGLYPSTNQLNLALYGVLYLITLLLGALLETGLIRFLYSLCKGQPLRERGLLFYAFRGQADTYILTYAFRYLVSLVWFAPALYFYMRIPVYLDLTDIPADLGYNLGMTLLLGLIALIPAVLCALPYCLSIYVLLDHPETSPLEALRTSRRLMRGQKRRMLQLWIGFLPLYLLGVGSLGIGFLWIQPYFHAAMGEAYLEITGQWKEPSPEMGETGQEGAEQEDSEWGNSMQ